jgi:hypothetical protein
VNRFAPGDRVETQIAKGVFACGEVLSVGVHSSVPETAMAVRVRWDDGSESFEPQALLKLVEAS